MNKKGNGGFIIGITLVTLGFLLSVGYFTKVCIKRGADNFYDMSYMSTCVSDPTTITLFVIGVVTATIGAFLCYGSRNSM